MDNTSLSEEPQVLIVENEGLVRESLVSIIRGAGYTCFEAASAEQALGLVANQHLDVVITDVRMEGINGLTLAERIRKHYDTDVIIITGYANEFSYEEAIEKGAADFAVKPLRPRELVARLKRVLRERTLIAERRQMETQLRELTITDDLTRLYNSRHFFCQLQPEIERTARYKHSLSLLLMDVDRFKHYNDSYGHLEGDKVLAKLGDVIRGCLRKNDSGYRYGGDEFTVLLPETKGEEAVRVAERIREEFAAIEFNPRNSEYSSSSTSIGIAQYRPGDDLKELTRRADEAMYKAKRSGGNRIVLEP